MTYVIPPSPVVSVPVQGTDARFPVHRVYCVGRNYEEHAKEMGFTGREPPFFFLKPADALVPVPAGETGHIDYPSLTKNLHHEVELVVAIGVGGRDILAADAVASSCSGWPRWPAPPVSPSGRPCAPVGAALPDSSFPTRVRARP